MKHAAHKGKGKMPLKTHMMPGGKEMPGEYHPTGKPAPKKIIAKRKR